MTTVGVVSNAWSSAARIAAREEAAVAFVSQSGLFAGSAS
jgi:hypothetical protein